MGMELLQGGYRNGEPQLDLVDIVTNPYFGGQPACQETTGLVRLAKSADDQAFRGLFNNSSYEDSFNGNATIVEGACFVRFINGSLSQDSPLPNGTVVEGAPYDNTVTFNPGDRLYIGSSGLWENTGTAGQEKGLVTKGNTATDDAVEAIMYPTITRASA
jgi:hypothetical protein